MTVQEKDLLGAPRRTRMIGSTRGECPGLLEVSPGYSSSPLSILQRALGLFCHGHSPMDSIYG